MPPCRPRRLSAHFLKLPLPNFAHTLWAYRKICSDNLTIQYNDGIYLEVIDFTPRLKGFELDFLIYLDRKVDINSFTAVNDKYKFALPYGIEDNTNFKVVDTKGFNLTYTIDSGYCFIKKNVTGVKIGFTYSSKWQIPTIYVRQANETSIKVFEGTLMLRDLILAYANTGYFVVKVSPK